jgi:hypothetical protein
MFKTGSHRAMAVVLALATLAFTASGVPDNRGTDAAIGWFDHFWRVPCWRPSR